MFADPLCPQYQPFVMEIYDSDYEQARILRLLVDPPGQSQTMVSVKLVSTLLVDALMITPAS